MSLETKYLRTLDGREFLTPQNMHPAEFDFIWHEIYGDVLIYEYEETPIAPGDIVLDLGANIGMFALRMMEKYQARVVCVEAAPCNTKCLKANLTKFGFIKKAIIVNKAIFSHNNGVKFNRSPQRSPGTYYVSAIYPEKAEPEFDISIPSVTIDSLVKKLKLNRVDFIKIDTEGSEVEAIIGGAETIRKYKPKMVIATYHKPEHPEQIYKLITAYRPDYQTKSIDKGWSDKVLVCW